MYEQQSAPQQQPGQQVPPPPHPYQQPAQQQAYQPYQQQPYPHQQPHPQQGPYPQQGPQHPYQQQAPQQAPQHPYQQQPGPYQQPAPHQPHPPVAATRHIPREANDMRRLGAVLLDGLLTLGAALIAMRAADRAGLPDMQVLYATLGAGFGLSFLNHVVLTRIGGASIGKFAVRTRVIRETDASRPRLPRLFRRWLGGYLFILVWIIAAFFDAAEGPEDFCGIRLVRFRDLRGAGAGSTPGR
ncbi:RDD family protein [Streptomyces sp. NPDC050355]|uniref:RDD family protein n=1 Tax=Streptomyces sp. NPDC050355 TaxID=3365609 RepID=UPI0037ADEA85